MSETADSLATASSPAVAGGPETAAVAAEPSRAGVADTDEEVDVWWGAYCGWTMLPSMVACVLLTGLIALGVWMWVPRGSMQWAFVGLGGALWIAQGLRWTVHVFGRTYRLTSRRLYVDCGLFRCRPLNIDLHEIAQVGVRRGPFEKLLRVGRVLIHFEDARPSLVLEGVPSPESVAILIREGKQNARAKASRAP
jgi:membrane protein YdbS with pleckstrin-like domain